MCNGIAQGHDALDHLFSGLADKRVEEMMQRSPGSGFSGHGH